LLGTSHRDCTTLGGKEEGSTAHSMSAVHELDTEGGGGLAGGQLGVGGGEDWGGGRFLFGLVVLNCAKQLLSLL